MESGMTPPTRRAGVVDFAATMFVVVGLFNIVYGLVVLLNEDYVTDNTLFADITAWGWIILITGIVQLITGGAIFNRRVGGQVFGIILATFGALLQLAFVAAFPVWSVIVIFLCGVIIYALTVYGDEFV